MRIAVGVGGVARAHLAPLAHGDNIIHKQPAGSCVTSRTHTRGDPRLRAAESRAAARRRESNLNASGIGREARTTRQS